MKNIKLYLQEAFNINQDNKPEQYTCQPKDRDELHEILKKRLAKDENANLNDIDVSKITDMRYAFSGLDPHDVDISEWDVSNVQNMNMMFYDCANFNADLSNWNVSNVETMGAMFDGCRKFTGKGLKNWDVSKVKEMGWMFSRCDKISHKPSWYKK